MEPGLPQHSTRLFCNICNVRSSGQVSLDQHYSGMKHKERVELLCRSFLNYQPTKPIKCVEDVFNDPHRKGTLIGLQFLRICASAKWRHYYECTLCGTVPGPFSIFSHLGSLEHKKNYITRAFPFLFEQKPELSDELEKIAEAIEAVEGITKFVTDLQSVQPSSESSPKQNVDRLIKKLAESGMHFEIPDRIVETVQCFETELHSSSPVQESTLKPLQGISTCKPVSALKGFCNICNVSSSGPVSLHQHYLGSKHKTRSELLCLAFLNHLPEKPIECVEDVFNDPSRKESLVGLQYLQTYTKLPMGLSYKCILCGYFAVTRSIFNHLVSLRHKEKYITKTFPFLFEQIPNPSSELVERAAEAVEAVEGISKFVTDHHGVKRPLDSSPEQIMDRLLEKLAESGMHVQRTGRNIKGSSTVNNQVSARSYKGHEHSKLSLSSSAPIPSLLEISTVVTNNQFSALPHKGHEHSQLSLSSSAPIPSLFASSSDRFSLGYQKYTPDDLPVKHAAEPPSSSRLFQATEHYISEKRGIAQERHVSVYQFSSSTLLADDGSFPSDLPWRPPFKNAAPGPGGEMDRAPKVYSNIIPNDVRSSYFAEGREHGQEFTPSGEKDLRTIRTISQTSSSIICSSEQFSAKDGSGHGASCYDGSSVSRESPLSPGITPVKHNKSTYPKSRGDTSLSKVYPPSGTISPCVQSSQVLDTIANIERIFSGLSPDILKILKGKDVATVKSILTRVSEYYSPLKEVNISNLVDILFETGALG